MLDEKNDIDQLFFRKLGQFEKTPPLSVWTGIEEQLKSLRRDRQISRLKTIGIAAAIVLAFFAGWRMNNSIDKSRVSPGAIAKQTVIKADKEPVTKLKTTNLQDVNTNTVSSSVHPLIENQASASRISSVATFPVNTPFVGRDDRLVAQKSDQQLVVNNERVLPDNFQKNFKKLDRINPMIVASLSNDLHDLSTADSKFTNTNVFKEIASGKAVKTAVGAPANTKNGLWSIRAEFAPVSGNRSQNKSQIGDFNSTSTQNNDSQQTISENSFSAGILTGYKISKRLNVRSGIVYNNIRKMMQKSDENRLKQYLEYVKIPVQIACKLVARKFSVGLTGGFNTNFLIGNKEVLSSNGDQISSGKISNVQMLVYSGAFGMEFGYDITKRIAVTIEPRFNHYLNSLSANNSINYSANQLEIATGLIYCFN